MDWKSRRIEAILEQALVEDKATSDVTTAITIEPDLRASATIIAKQDCVVSGLGCIPRFLEIFARLDKRNSGRYEVVSHPEIFEGVRVKKGQAIAVIRHNARVILACERVILNLMQRMSGISTVTRQYADAISGTGARVLDTRKTIPGLRTAQKYAVRVGGGHNHRMGLFDGILIKENHIAAAGSIALAVAAAKRQPEQVPVEVEVENLMQLQQAIDAGADIAMLDNFTLPAMREAVALNTRAHRPLKIEASGGITPDTIRAIAQSGVDFISVGSITKHVRAVDLSMRFEWRGAA